MKTKAICDLLKHCKDIGNPKAELDGIFVTGNKLVCTDTKQLLVLEFEDNFTQNDNETVMLFDKMPKEFNFSRPKEIWALLDANGCLLEDMGLKICVPYREKLKGEGKVKYPDYERILNTYTKNIKGVKKANIDFIDGNYSDSDDYLYYLASKLNNGFFASKFLLKFGSILKKTQISFRLQIMHKKGDNEQEVRPLKIIGTSMKTDQKLKGFTYLCMPILLND